MPLASLGVEALLAQPHIPAHGLSGDRLLGADAAQVDTELIAHTVPGEGRLELQSQKAWEGRKLKSTV